MLYHCDNARFDYKLAKVNTPTPSDMRAPGAATGVNALEIAMDELAYEAGIDPLELRRINFSTKDENDDKLLTSKALDACYQQGANAFGWDDRRFAPRSMREGHELIGWGMASGVWEAMVMNTTVSVRLLPDGHLHIETAASEIGTGTWTLLTQIGADAFGASADQVTVRIGQSDLPAAPVVGGSWTAASSGSALQAACEAVKKTLFSHARKMTNSPLAHASFEDVEVREGRIFLRDDHARGLSIHEVMDAADLSDITEEGKAAPDVKQMLTYASYTHSAVFAEVRVDEDLGIARVTRGCAQRRPDGSSIRRPRAARFSGAW
jgi:xanthine dehydrogenase YagR molybdenum-binding subunit